MSENLTVRPQGTLVGKTAIVTGGSRGIGAAIVEKMAANGADVAVIYAGNVEAAEAVCRTCEEKYGVKMKAYRCNVADFENTKETVAQIKADFGTVHILVNNAGITRDGLVAMMREEAFDAVLDTNLKGAFNMIRHCTSLFLRAREGCIRHLYSWKMRSRISATASWRNINGSVMWSLWKRCQRPSAEKSVRQNSGLRRL